MADNLIGGIPEENAEPGSLFATLRNSNPVTNAPEGFGDIGWKYGDRPDKDPLGVESTVIAESGSAPITSNTVTGLDIPTGKDTSEWVTREELMKTEAGRKLVTAEEDIRRGHKRNFFDGLFGGPLTDFVPFMGMFASVGNDLSDAGDVKTFYENALAGKPTTRDQAIKAMLYERENALANDGDWGYKFGSIVRQAPAFFAEFGALGKAGQAARTAIARGITKEATDEAAKKASVWALTRAAKTGTDEYADLLVRQYVAKAAKETGMSAVEAARELGTNAAVKEGVLRDLTTLSKQLVTGVQNAAANPEKWAEGLAEKVAKVRSAKALESAISRASTDSVVAKAWNGLRKSAADAMSEGLIDLGSWGSEAATVITTGEQVAKKAALDAAMQLTVGAASRGAAMYLPKEALASTIGSVGGFVGQNELALKGAAFRNDDQELMDKAGWMGMFMDLMEYVSESTGRGFNSAFRAAGLAISPKLFAPTAKTAGLLHPVEANIVRDAAGKATGVTFNGLFERGQQAEVGGVIRRYLEKKFGGTALKENVAEDQYKAAVHFLEKNNVRIDNPAALRATIADKSIQPGVSAEVASAIGTDVGAFLKKANKVANADGLEGMKIRGTMLYHAANYMAEHNIDAIAAADAFRQMGYDGVVSEMFEERYSDVVNAIFGMNAHKDQSLQAKFTRAWRSAFGRDEDTGEWKVGDLLAEAAAFAVPLVARSTIMRGIAAMGGPNQLQKFKDWASLYHDGTRYASVGQMRRGDYLQAVEEQKTRLVAEAANLRKQYDDEIEARRVADEKKEPYAAKTEAEMKALQDEAARYDKAVSRLDNLRESFVASIVPKKDANGNAIAASESDLISAPMYEDSYLMSSDEEYNLRLHPTEAQLGKSMGAYNVLVNGAAEAFQTEFKSENRVDPVEDAGWFRKAAHRIASGTLRLTGAAVTGDMSFLSVNPARWAGNDRSLPDDILQKGMKLYGDVFRSELAAEQAARADLASKGEAVDSPSQSSYDVAHERALEKVKPMASRLMAELLAAHQTRMMYDSEIKDVAMSEVATQDGLSKIAGERNFVNSEGNKVSFDEYVARPGVKERIDSVAKDATVDLYSALTRGFGLGKVVETSKETGTRSVEDLMNVPSDLPTARQAILEKVISSIPSLRRMSYAIEADAYKPVEDQLGGMATDQRLVDEVVAAVAPDGISTIDGTFDLQMAAKRVASVDEGTLSRLALDLNIESDGTVAGITKRNEEIARIAVAESVARDDAIRVFSRASTAAERDDRLGSPRGVFVTARMATNGTWVTSLRTANGDVVTAADATQLDQVLQNAGFSRVNPRVVFTSAKVLQSSDPLTMIRALGLGEMYRRRCEESGCEAYQLDPIIRKDNGSYVSTDEDAADVLRLNEKSLSDLFEAKRKQGGAEATHLFLREGESADNQAAMARASALQKAASRAWYSRNGRTEDGKAMGYIAQADDLLREYGVTVPNSKEGNAYGLTSQTLRNKYVISIRSLRSMGATGNVYVPINHGEAQDYESALLDGSLLTAYARNTAYIRNVFPTLISSFVDQLDAVAETIQLQNKDSNPRLADKIADFRNFACSRNSDQVRIPSPSAFAAMVSAFNLYRTEFDGTRVATKLGHHAEALVALAPHARKLTSFIGFTAAVDRILGGTGFETSLLTNKENPSSGLARYWSVFSPVKSLTMSKALSDAHPGKCKDFSEFVTRATGSAQAAAGAAKVAPSGPAAELAVVQQVAVENNLSPEEVMPFIAERLGETYATIEGGNTTETIDIGRINPETLNGIRIGGEEENDELQPIDDQWDMGAAPAATAVVARQASEQIGELLPSEAKVAVKTFAAMATIATGSIPNSLTFKDLVKKLVPGIRKADLDEFSSIYRYLKKDDKISVDLAQYEDLDDEGIDADGTEHVNQRSVDMLKAKALSNFLAMMNMVSPSTGRDFQPFVEDLRSITRSYQLVVQDADASVKEAFEFLGKLLNPRSEECADGAPGRDSIWRHRMDAFKNDRKRIAKYIKAFLGTSASAPVSGRAALLLSYLASIPENARINLASLIGGSAPSAPVSLERSDVNGDVVFQLTPYRRKGGSISMDAIAGSFTRLAGMSKAELKDTVDGLVEEFRKSMKAGMLNTSRGLLTRFSDGHTGVLDEYARILGPVLGWDSPLVSMFVSSQMAARVGGDYLDARARGETNSTYSKLLAKFGSADGVHAPAAVNSLISTLRAASEEGSVASFIERAVTMFQSGSPKERNVTGAATSLQGASMWADLAQAYANAKPVSVMTAVTDPERTSRPSSSLAITMCGVEPALQEFMDRSDDKGFVSVVKEWFPNLSKLSDADFLKRIGSYRQRMVWPNSRADNIVAKSVSKSALASETFKGCKTAYDLETMSDAEFAVAATKYGEKVSRYVRRNMVYVPVYSGDHASSIIIQVPLAKEFKAKGMDYETVAEMVSSWVGLDLLGVDAKRSALTCLEAPGTSMWDYRYDDNGEVIRNAETGEAERGHAYVSIVWNSDPKANNEAMIGTTGLVGYGAKRQKEIAGDTRSNTVKCHIASVGEDAVYGPTLSLIKSLAVAMPEPESGYTFVAGSPMAFLQEHACKLIKGEEDISTVTYTDFDSIKLGVANSKTTFAGYNEKGKPVALMQYVFNRISQALQGKLMSADGKTPVEVKSSMTGAELDELVGPIEWVNLGGSGKSGKFMLSELLNGASIREVTREGDFGGNRMFSLDYIADNQMAFQVANVSHRARSDYEKTPRNNMLDAQAMAKNLETYNAGKDIFAGCDDVLSEIRELVASWGFIGGSIAVNDASIRNLLANDEGYQRLLRKGTPENGQVARDYRMRVYAAYAKKNFVNVPIRCIQTPLTTNAGWIGEDGMAHSHSASKMFNDTLQGARTIASSERTFMRGVKYAAIANVNCSDKTFRHGLYVNEEALLNSFKSVAETVASVKAEKPGSYRQIVALLDHVITTINREENKRKAAYVPEGETMSWREKLAWCLMDHHGAPFAERKRTMEKTLRDDEGKVVLDENGNVSKERRDVAYWEDVSFDDLFTASTAAGKGEMDFDRTAVYPSMHLDADQKDHVYLGGTLMGIPRTPSYNGSMWLQNARAGLPVTERFDENSKQWTCGNDAMVSPDPFTLAILGCDHDGDKTTLYMLSGDGNYARASFLAEGVDETISKAGLLDEFISLSPDGKAAVEAYVKRLSDLGYVEFEAERGKDKKVTAIKGLKLTAKGQSKISNAFVQGLFDMNRMLPVGMEEGGKAVYAGPVRDGVRNVGALFGATKAAMGPKSDDAGVEFTEGMWDKAISEPGVMSAKVLDAGKGAIIGKPGVAAEVQTGAAVAAEARAIIVSTASSLHFAYQSGMKVGPFRTRDVSAKEWIDFMYHVDGLSNMTFDDIKEQICSRLGVKPNMIETIIADLINGGGANRLPTTDQEFLTAFCKYAKSANDPNGSRHWMARASDPADFEFRKMFSKFKASDVTGFIKAMESVAESQPTSDEKAYYGVFSEALSDYYSKTRDRIKQPLNGFAYWFVNVCPENKRKAAMDDVIAWLDVMGQLREAKTFGNTINYTGSDPAANDASAKADSLGASFYKLTKELSEKYGSEALGSPEDLANAERMRAGTALLYDRSVGEVVATAGIRAVTTFQGNRDKLVSSYANAQVVPGQTSREALLTMAAYAVPTLQKSDAMRLQANAQSVGWSIAAFNTTPQIPGSRINASNAYEVLETIGRALASIRHHKAPGANVTLDVRYGIESMLDLVARFTVNSTMHEKLPIFDYLRETPDANAYGFTESSYGPAARGLSRIRLSMSGVTESQIEEARGLYARVVSGRELDSDGRLGSGTYKSTTGFEAKYPLNLSLSTANLKSMKKFVDAQKSKAVVSEKSAEQGNARVVSQTIDELLKVFAALDKRFGDGFTVQPSSLFGQILPIYASITDRVEGAPEAGSSHLLALMGDRYEKWSSEFARIEASKYEPLVSMATAVNWDAVQHVAELVQLDDNALVPTDYKPEYKTRNVRSRRAAALGAMQAEDEFAANIDDFKKLRAISNSAMKWGKVIDANGNVVNGMGEYYFPARDDLADVQNPRNRQTLSVFDGARGVFYRQVLHAVNGRLSETMRNPFKKGVAKAKVAPVVDVAPAVTPSPVTVATAVPSSMPEAPKAPSPIATEGRDEKVAAIADRMGAVLKMWDKGRVEYNGGDTFAIYGKFHDGDWSYEARIDVNVRNGSSLLTDAEIWDKVNKGDAAYLKSLSNRTGKSMAELNRMDKPTLFKLASKNRPVGRSIREHVGDAPGEFRLSADMLGKLVGRIELAKDAEAGTEYHELFHSVMGFMRTLGAFSADDIKVLNQKYGDHATLGKDWFDEEKAADDFRKLVEGTIEPGKSGVLDRIREFLENLADVLFDFGNVEASDYANDIEDSPLAQIVLTGRTMRTDRLVENLDLTGRIAKAVKTYHDSEGTMFGGKDDSDMGRSILDFTSEEIEAMDTVKLASTREGSIFDAVGFKADNVDYTKNDCIDLANYIDGLERIARDLKTYEESNGPEAAKDQKRKAVSALDKSFGIDGSYFHEVYSKFMKKYAPTPVDRTQKPEAIEVEKVIPNEARESDISDFIKGATIVAGEPADTDYGFTNHEDAWDLQPVTDDVRSALRANGIDRMARPYNRMNMLAREVGRTIKAGFIADSAAKEAFGIATYVRTDEDTAVVKDAVRHVASVYGVELGGEPDVRNLVYRAVHEIRGMVGKPEGGTVNVGGTTTDMAENVTAPVVAAAITTATGLRPNDVVDTAIADIDAIASGYPESNTFVLNVVNPIRKMFVDLSKSDATRLMEDRAYQDSMIWDSVASIMAGFEKDSGKRLPDGSYDDFRLATGVESGRGDAEGNRLRYADHIENNPDFQKLVHTALDRLFLLGASMRFYRQLGFEPGRPEDTIAVAGQIAPKGMPAPMTPAEAMTAFNAAPEQLADANVEIVDFFDQPYFTANHAEAWLDSMTRPRFGEVSLRDSAQNGARNVAGFHSRINSVNNYTTRLMGLDIQPGQAVTAIDRTGKSKFAMEGGETVRKDGENVTRFLAYGNVAATDTNGKPVVFSISDTRRADFYLKAIRVWASGSRRMVTGVDGLTFSENDKTDESYYSWAEVQKRESNIVGGYSDFDRVLVRLMRQLHDDANGEDWKDIVGPEGLDLYNSLVREACSAMRDGHRLMGLKDRNGNPVLTVGGFNSFVLARLEQKGLAVGRERFVKALGRTAYTEGTVAIDVDKYDAFFRNSDTWTKLKAAGRLESEMTREAIAKPIMTLWREVREFIDANPYLTDGDGSFFHNAATPVPFIQGDGYFMYAANRRAHDSAKAVSESMSEYEKAFFDLCTSAAADTPASSASDSMMLMFRTLFHTDEVSARAVRDAMASGAYDEKYNLSANATQRDLALAIYNRLCGMVWKQAGDPVAKRLGGEASVGRMIRFFEKYAGAKDSVVTGGCGMTDEMMYRMHGVLPYSHQLGHAVQNAIDGIGNAFAFRASLFNLMTTPAADGMPVCYVKPSKDAVQTGGLPDQLWGTVARWWAETNGIKDVYDPAKTGIENAIAVYDKIHGTMKDGQIGGLQFGELSKTEIDAPSVDGLIARMGTPEEESKLADIASGYALGYAKHLMQSTRAMGKTWQRKLIHRAYSYSKSLSVSFSYFFPLATRFESPIGAIGAIATLGGNMPGGAELLREHSDILRKIMPGTAWITKDFLGQRDVFEMLDSNDPYLAELYHWAGCLGLSLSDSSVNPLDHSRGIMQEDLKKVVALARRAGGTKVAARLDSVMKAILTRGGDRAFTYHLNATKLAVVAQLCQRLQAEAARHGVAFDPVRDLKRYSGYINAEVGGIDPLKYAWAHPASRNWLNSLFFSWEWTRGAWEAGGGPLIEQLFFGGHDMTMEERHHMLGRWSRMFLEVMVGVPMLFQVISKLTGEALIAGLDPDDPTLDEVERERLRRLVAMVKAGKWFTFENESKIGITGYDVTPLMAGIAARFPSFADYAKSHPLMYAAPTIAAAMMGKPWLMLGTLPVYTGRDKTNTTGGRRYYQRYGKQGWEFFRWFEAPFTQFLSKLPMPVQRLAEGLFGRSLTYMDHPQPQNSMGEIERWISPTAESAWFNMARAFVPFSLTSLADTGDAGALSVLGPVSMGASQGNLTKRLANEINAWASNDRRGYAFGGPSATKAGQFKKWAPKNMVTVAKLIEEAKLNGLSEKDAYGLIDTAVRNLTGGVYDKLVDQMPTEPDQDFDEVELGKTLRKANRLGMLRKNLYKTLCERLEKQNRWFEVREEERERIRKILSLGRETPYGVTNEAVGSYDY